MAYRPFRRSQVARSKRSGSNGFRATPMSPPMLSHNCTAANVDRQVGTKPGQLDQPRSRYSLLPACRSLVDHSSACNERSFTAFQRVRTCRPLPPPRHVSPNIYYTSSVVFGSPSVAERTSCRIRSPAVPFSPRPIFPASSVPSTERRFTVARETPPRCPQ